VAREKGVSSRSVNARQISSIAANFQAIGAALRKSMED